MGPEANRLVTINANRGAVVRSVSLDDVREIVDIRLALEPLAIAMAVPQMGDQDVDRARDVLESYADVDDPVQWSALNWAFHFSLYRPCGSPRLLAMIESLYDEVLRLAHINISVRQGNEEAHREHRCILASCCKRDAEQAAARLKAHLARSKKSLDKLLAVSP